MKRKFTIETLKRIKNRKIRLAAAYGASGVVLKAAGATDDELTILGFTVNGGSNETANDN